ncbi:MAG: penicillin-binding protein 2 [Pseudomonadota bacterium]
MTDFAAPIRRRLAPRPAGPAPAPDAARAMRDDWRLILVMLAFALFYGVLALNMALMALSDPEEPRLGRAGQIDPVRSHIVDRQGRLLAANLPAWSLYAHPHDVLDPVRAAAKLGEIFPYLTAEEALDILTQDSRFVWVERPVTPRQKQAVMDIGDPGLLFGSREMRLYPAGRTVAHVIGGVTAGEEDVRWAEIEGAGGVERYFDERLRDPARAGAPLSLSIDLALQTALSDVLQAEMTRLGAQGAAGVFMAVETGEILALVSLPDYDPNKRKTKRDEAAGASPRFNRAVQGRYELGSVFKPLTAAMALDRGVVGPETMIETGKPIFYGRQRVRDYHRMPEEMSVTDIIRRSSNVGSAKLALAVTTPHFRGYLDRLGMFAPVPVELSEAAGASPLLPPKWTELSTMNISFGHGIAVSPLHLAGAYATIANGGRRVIPTLQRGGRATPVAGEGERVFSAAAAAETLRMMRRVVTDGSGRRARVPGYRLAGKTGTADKPDPVRGGYDRTKVMATFGAIFPVDDPQYVLVVTMDEPTDRSGQTPSRQASRTAAPVAAEAVRRLAPILGLRPASLEGRP